MEGKPTSPQLLQNLNRRSKQVIFTVVLYLILVFICLISVVPTQYDLNVGEVSPVTITASKDVVDELTTERRRKAAADAVSPVYYKDDTVSDTVLANIEKVFSELRSVRELGQQIRSSWTTRTGTFTDDDYAQAQKLLSVITLSNYQLQTLMRTDESDFESLYRSLTSAARTALVSTITEGQLGDAISNIQQIVAYNTRTDLWYNVAIPILRGTLQPNMLIDQQVTEENRQKARDAVEPTVYKKDQNVVVKGDRVTTEKYAVLDALGLLAGKKTDYFLYISSSVLILSFLALTYLYIYLFIPKIFQDAKSALVMGISLILTLVLCILMGMYIDLSTMPMLLAAMLVVNLLGAREAYAVNFLLSLILTFVTMKRSDFETSQMLGVLLASTLGGILVIFLMRRNSTRIFVIIDGLIAGFFQLILLACVLTLSSSDTSDVFARSMWVIMGALFSAIVCIGLQSVFESLFNLTTPSKLIELSSPSQPLLKRLMIETPGTYHHSMVVANLAEAAAEAVGANALLCRVGAYYHDIGKLIRPMYFKENQMGENPHDHTDPRVSTAILTEHTLDGVELAKKHHLPEPIIDMIRQHHGDTPVMYFYAKAVQQYGEENVDIAEFRYAGPKPQSAEAGILMMADTVEAAVRSIPEPTHEKISQMIRKLIRGKMEDGQLDDCPLTFRDIGRITFAFETVLQGVFHERIEYPDLNKIRDRSRKKKQQMVQK